ncbi:hypothetical protein DQB62_04115 [Shigella flexneri]|nr:hypothetical protein [Shigella flexneri]
MKVKADITVIPERLDIKVKGLLLTLPRSDFYDPENPSAAFARLLRYHVSVCEAIKDPTEFNSDFPKTFRIEFSGGHLTDIMVTADDNNVEVYGEFCPGGVYGDDVRNFIIEHGYVELKPRIRYHNDKILEIRFFDINLAKSVKV